MLPWKEHGKNVTRARTMGKKKKKLLFLSVCHV